SQGGRHFIAGPGDQAADSRGMINGARTPSPLGPLLIADDLHDHFAQWLGQFLLEKQGFSKRWDSPRWLDLIFHDDHLAAVPPQAAGIPLVRYMPQGGMVDMRSGWHIGNAKAHDIDAWFYLGPMTAHSEMDAGHFTLWRGDDDLLTEGSNYLSRPTTYHLLWSVLSLARNTAVFAPEGSKAPELDGSQRPIPTMTYDDNRMFGDVGGERLVKSERPATRARIACLSAEHYPIANRLVWYPEYAGYLGRITYFHNGKDIAVTSGDATVDYDPKYVESYQRTVIDVKPNVFILRDRFRLRHVATVRLLFHTRERPKVEGLRVIKGTAEAGILEARANRVTIDHGGSQAVIEVLWPRHVTIRLIGGPGYEDYYDGRNIRPYPTGAEWLVKQPDYPQRLARIAGAWRIEIVTTQAAAKGQTILAISVGPRGATPPSFQLTRNKTIQLIDIKRNNKEISVPLSDRKLAEPADHACPGP
ncbi:MAG: hypothetical protein ACREE3_14120, partial [Stellaceae bacterium]